MENDGGKLPVGGENRSLEEISKFQAILGCKVNAISKELRNVLGVLGNVTANLRNREYRNPGNKGACGFPMGVCGRQRACRHVQPAQPEFLSLMN